ncbi:MAG: carbohydrate ABC transporter permease [Thermoprotei archaeon]|nr:MAG: carbohydrate ABC transporter permease [Thermoprotei archaeon]
MKIGRAIVYFLVVLSLIWTLFPIYWVTATSFKPNTEVITKPPTWIPRNPTLEHYYRLFAEEHFHIYILNTAIVSIGSTILALLLGAPASYAVARHRISKTAGRSFLAWNLIVRMFPPIVLAIPIFTVFRQAGLINTRAGLILAYQVYSLPYAIWLLHGFFREIPHELEEAAMVDGASILTVFTKIALPLAIPGIVTTAILTIIQTWNEFLYALIFIYSQEKMTITVQIAGYIQEFKIEWGLLASSGLISSLPVLALSAAIQKYFTQGLAAGRGIKG